MDASRDVRQLYVFKWLDGLSTSRTSGQKRRRSVSNSDDNMQTPTKQQRHNPTGEEPTPRASQTNALIGLSSPPDSLVIRPAQNPFQQALPPAPTEADDAQSLSSVSSTSGTSRKRKREPSPKKAAALRNAVYGVRLRTIERWSDVPVSIQPLVKSMMRTRLAYGIVPDKYPDLSRLSDGVIDDAQLMSPTRQSIGASPDADFVAEVLYHVRRNRQYKASEAAWNCNVHWPILHQAWRSSPHRDRIHWHNITTAAIEPSSLLPALTPTGSFQSKKADFAMTLELDASIEAMLARSGVESLNQTFYEPLCYSPLALSLESKISGENWSDATVQISTWALSQIAKLNQLLSVAGNGDGKEQVPPLPLLVVQGEQWIFLTIEAAETNAVLWEKVVIGDTLSHLGVHQVVTALQYLMDWAETTYRPWFERAILQPLLAAAAKGDAPQP